MNQSCKDCGLADKAPGRSRCYPCYGLHRKGGASTSEYKVLYLDIETTPMNAWVWGSWQQNVYIDQIVQPQRVMCFSAKWQGGKNQFFSEWQHGHDDMIVIAHDLLDQADAVVHYYGSKFDIPHLNSEFLTTGLTPPAPYKQIDLKLAVSKNFKFPSNKLQYVSTLLGLDGKHKTDFELWLDVMAGKTKAQKYMEKYNRQDVDLLEDLYHRLLPWIPSLPNRNLFDGKGGCTACASLNVEEDGEYKTSLTVYRRFICLDCGKWMRSSKRIGGVKLQGAVL